MKRIVTTLELILICIICVLGICLVLSITGCASPRQNFYGGQMLDAETTVYALEQGYADMNPFIDQPQDVVLLKLAYIGLIEFMAYLYPDYADTVYCVGGIMGYGLGAYNVFYMAGHK